MDNNEILKQASEVAGQAFEPRPKAKIVVMKVTSTTGFPTFLVSSIKPLPKKLLEKIETYGDIAALNRGAKTHQPHNYEFLCNPLYVPLDVIAWLTEQNPEAEIWQ